MVRVFRSLTLFALLAPLVVHARSAPEDSLKGQIIISDRKIPSSWSSVSSYVSQLKGMKKETFWYDKKTGKVTLQRQIFNCPLAVRGDAAALATFLRSAANAGATGDEGLQRISIPGTQQSLMSVLLNCL